MLEPPVEQTREFTVSGFDAAFAARRAFTEVAHDWLPAAVTAEARLLVSELVTAVALGHETPTPIDLRLIRIGERGVRGEIDIPPRVSRQSPRAFRLVAGHRAQILDAVADRWGIVNTGAAPYAWFELGRA
jgi:hypothetical protein